ncbi:hypothetical protein FACS1894152_3340 [Bacilli bacterium]|nr:hypothetical protein FACS1894152_3340 [Bacilli bacterium]
MAKELKEKVLNLIKTKYYDFGATLLAEHLEKEEHILNHQSIAGFLITGSSNYRERINDIF